MKLKKKKNAKKSSRTCLFERETKFEEGERERDKKKTLFTQVFVIQENDQN